MKALPPTPGGSGEHTYRDALAAKVRGRGAGLNPGNRFESLRLHVLGEQLDADAAEHPEGSQSLTRVFADSTRTLINHVDSPDLFFSWTVNPYRGCEHGCIYCYARPGHEYFSLSSGLDFETKIFAKQEAPQLLRRELMHTSWKGEVIIFSGVTDAYQPVERDLKITRRCLEVCVEFRQAVSIITKNSLVERDLDLLEQLNAFGGVSCAVSLTTLDPTLASRMEPRASSPTSRLKTMRLLASHGIPVTVMAAPLIPRINDHEMPAILEAAKEAGATAAGYTFVRLPHQIKALFLEWLTRHFPDRAAHVETLIRSSRGGDLYDATFFSRHRGTGEYADQLARTFKLFARKLGLDMPRRKLNTSAFQRPGTQQHLFE